MVTAETGAGKSTRVPVWLAERFEGLILVVEPRRVACCALAEYLSSQRGERTGGYFGSRVRFADRSGRDTRVLFCTPGVALRMLAGDATPGAIVVDEFHERSWQMDLVVAAAVNLLLQTVETEELSENAKNQSTATARRPAQIALIRSLWQRRCQNGAI